MTSMATKRKTSVDFGAVQENLPCASGTVTVDDVVVTAQRG